MDKKEEDIIGEQFGKKETAVLIAMFFGGCIALFVMAWIVGTIIEKCG
jgi:HAMP domain-containing protein